MSDIPSTEGTCAVVGCNGVPERRYYMKRDNFINKGSVEETLLLCHGHAVDFTRLKTAFLLGEMEREGR